MKHDNLITGKDALLTLFKGIKKCADAVGSTMGTGGSNAFIQANEYPGHFTTNDGATILENIRLADPIEELGREVLMEAVSRANKKSGDGSSTTTVLTRSIIEEGLNSDSPFLDIKRGLDACIPQIESLIDEQTREITVDEVGAVAAISAEDTEIANLIQDIYKQIGKDGLITWDVSKTTDDFFEVSNGIRIHDCKLISPYMCDIDDSGNFLPYLERKNPKILLTKQKVSSLDELTTFLQNLSEEHNTQELIIFCDEFEPTLVPILIGARQKGIFNCSLVKMPVIWKDEWYTDLSKATGATVIDPTAGLTLKTITIDQLGTVDYLKIEKEDAYLEGIKDLSSHIKELQDEGTDESLHRASRLNTKSARLYLGAHSDSALAYKRLKTEDAIAAAHHALNGGIVAGGGVALKLVADQIDNPILKKALLAPFNQILKNAGVAKIQTLKGTQGIDTRTGKKVDMFEAEITDPAVIVKNAIRNAISVAGAVLTTETLITFPHEDIQLVRNVS